MAPPRTNHDQRTGFTLIELLVSIAIMAVMAAMVLPAVQSARRSARAIHCRSNLAQLGEAFHAYHLTQGALPSGSVDQRSPALPGPDRFVWGWALQLSPWIGEHNRWRALDASHGILAPVNTSIVQETPALLQCPAGAPREHVGYAGCYNHEPFEIRNDTSGALTLNSHVRFSELIDGTHQTILLGEAREVRWAEGTFGSLRHVGETWQDPVSPIIPEPVSQEKRLKIREEIRQEVAELEALRIAVARRGGVGYPPPPPVAEPLNSESAQDDSLPPLDDSTSPESTAPGMASSLGSDNPNYPPVPPNVVALPPSQAFGFWPVHEGSCHFLLADGAVRLISQSVDPQVLQRLANRFDTRDPGAF